MIEATYHSNYNGWSLIDTDEIVGEDVLSAVENVLVELTGPECDEDGYFDGVLDDLNIEQTVKDSLKEFGIEVNTVVVEKDTFST